jgi:TorA maturation chaperone TorD
MMDSQPLELASLIARRELWLLVSVGFVDPYNRQRFDWLRDQTFRLRAIDAAALLAQEHSAIELGPGEIHPRSVSPEGFFAALDAHSENLDTAYRQVFGLTAVSEQCPPCETEWEPNTDVFYRCQRLADISGFYQAFGLDVSTRAGERPDHITAEAEFMYVLLAKEAAALYEGNQEGAEVCREARGKFFHEHVGWWLPAFAWALTRVAHAGYYVPLAALTSGLSAIERVGLGLPPFARRVIPKPSQMETETACAGCG